MAYIKKNLFIFWVQYLLNMKHVERVSHGQIS